MLRLCSGDRLKRESRGPPNSNRDDTGTRASRHNRRHQLRRPGGPPLPIEIIVLWLSGQRIMSPGVSQGWTGWTAHIEDRRCYRYIIPRAY